MITNEIIKKNLKDSVLTPPLIPPTQTPAFMLEWHSNPQMGTNPANIQISYIQRSRYAFVPDRAAEADRPGGGPGDSGRGGAGGLQPGAHRQRELRLPGGARRSGLCDDQQIRRGLPQTALLRRMRFRGCRRGARPPES